MKLFRLLLISMVLFSCSSEKVTLSPMYDATKASEVSSAPLVRQIKDKTGTAFYLSELSSNMSTMPKFSNSRLNQEVATLKFHMKQYIYDVQSYNLVGQERSLDQLERSYKKIQSLRGYLNPNDDEVINRYLVRIKSNIAQIEELTDQNSK